MNANQKDELTSEELRNFLDIAAPLTPSPGEVPRLDGVEIAGVSMPFGGLLGGDHIIYIDFKKRYDLEGRIKEAEEAGLEDVLDKLRRCRRRAGILLADVSGHRTTDALIAAMLHQAFLLGAYYELDRYGEITTTLFEHINTRFHKTSGINKYFTMIYGEISERGRFRFISAGHHPPLVFSREFGRFMPISRDRLISFPPVGVFPSSDERDERDEKALLGYKERYQVNQIDLLAAGDILLLYTDGLAEHADGRYCPDKLEATLRQVSLEPAETIVSTIQEDLLSHAEPDDDLTFIVIKMLARPGR